MKNLSTKRWFTWGFLVLLALVGSAHAQERIEARVVGVTYGDTTTVLAPGNEQYTIRLAGIDAPEHNQAFG
jgi:endonuclease YncB( thermonuclease family)